MKIAALPPGYKTVALTSPRMFSFGAVTLPQSWHDQLAAMREKAQQTGQAHYASIAYKDQPCALVYIPTMPVNQRYCIVIETQGPIPGVIEYRFNDAFEFTGYRSYPNPHGDNPNMSADLLKTFDRSKVEKSVREFLDQHPYLGNVMRLPRD